MTQEDKEQLLKDLCGRLLYNLKVKINRNGSILTLYEIFEDKSVYLKVDDTALRGWNEKIEDIKPYLRPLSSMTEEERRYLLEELGFDEDLENGELNDFGSYVYRSVNVLPLFDWLNSHHLDYRGLIENGLALEAPNDMYKTKN